MDDTEDDARYPPNPHPTNHRRTLPSSHRPKLPVRNSSIPPSIAHNYAADDNEEGDEEDEQNDIDHPMDEAEDDNEEEEDDDDYGGGYGIIRDDDDSSESRGKRRKLDNFEFAPRVAAGAPSVIPPPSGRNSPADWSEDSTFVLLDAWGELYLQNGRKSIRSDEWSEVSKKVSQASKTARSDVQCRNRVDTLKKKYKKEKARMDEAVISNIDWVYFKKMDALMSSTSPPPPVSRQQQEQPLRLPCGVDAGEYVFTSSRVYLNRSNGMDEMRDSPGDTGPEDDEEEEDNESDGLPPKRGKLAGNSESSFRMLADSIQKFGDIYEKIENNKKQQMAELERMRKEFQKDLEVQKSQILERAQVEIAKMRQEEGEEEEEGEERTEDDDGNDDDNDVST